MKTKNRERVQFDAKKFAAYAVAGVAAVAVADTANADITYSVINTLIEDTTAPAGTSLDPDDNGVGLGLAFGDASSFNLDFYHGVGLNTASTGFAIVGGDLFGGTNGVSVAGFFNGNYGYASNVASGANISALTNWIAPRDSLNAVQAGTMAFNGGFASSQFLAPGDGFLAVRYDNGGGFSFGWVRVTMNGNPLNSYTIVDAAFADPGEALAVGEIAAVPEPGSLACLALGALGLATWRRRRYAA